jgi:hypothetical protein
MPSETRTDLADAAYSELGGLAARFSLTGILDDPAQDEIRAPILLLIILQFAFQHDLRLTLRQGKTGLRIYKELTPLRKEHLDLDNATV